MTSTDIKTEDLIKSLSGELKEVKVLRHPLHRVLPWLAFACAYLVFNIAWIGLRADIAVKIHDPEFILEIILATAISLSAALCASWLCTPDMRGQKWMLAVPASLFSVFVIWMLLRATMEHGDYHPTLHLCYVGALIFGVAPAISMYLLSRQGKTTHPVLIAFMNILSIGAVGYIGLRIVCISDDIGHLCTFHIAPYLLFGLGIALLAKRIYRW